MPKYAMEFAYDGTGYCGWQIQRGVGSHENPAPSIEGTLVSAIESLCKEEVTVVASGRTDSGVHASGQVAHFSVKNPEIPDEHFLPGLNHLLPGTIRIHGLGRVPEEFNAKHACRKQYSYYFQQGPSNLPHLRDYTMWNRYPLHGPKMNEAVQALKGEHDFSAFCGAGAKVSTTVRHLYEAEVTREEIPLPGSFDSSTQFLWRVRLLGSGFLTQMARGIAGTLKQIGEERRSPGELKQILEAKDRSLVAPTAPASGLWLDRVWYPPLEGIEFLHQFPRQLKIWGAASSSEG